MFRKVEVNTLILLSFLSGKNLIDAMFEADFYAEIVRIVMLFVTPEEFLEDVSGSILKARNVCLFENPEIRNKILVVFNIYNDETLSKVEESIKINFESIYESLGDTTEMHTLHRTLIQKGSVF